MLVDDPVVVDVPTGAVDEIEVVGDFDEPHATLQQPPRQQATLAELTAIRIPQVGRFLVQVEDTGKLGTGQFQALGDRRVVIGDLGVRLKPLHRLATLDLEHPLAPRLAIDRNPVGSG